MQQQSEQQLLDDRQKVLAQYKATTDHNRRAIYKKTIDEIDRRLAALQQPQQRQAPATAPQPKPQAPPPSRPGMPIAPPAAPSQNRRHTAPAPTTVNVQPAPPAPAVSTGATIVDFEPPAPRIVVNAVAAGAPTVSIEWADGREPETLTEGSCRQRFDSYLRDTAALRCVELGRWADLPRYTSFVRAAGYYAALCQFWGRQPGTTDLGIYNLSRAKAQVFQIIQNSDAQHG